MQLRINARDYAVAERPDRALLWVLRDELGLSGTRFGCGAGLCGACVVQLDGRPVRSCQTPISAAAGKPIRTIEGLAPDAGSLHPVQQAFIDHQVPQCGWCMSGQIMTAAAFLQQNPAPSEDDVIEAMGENYCRCGCYHRIKQAVVAAAGTMNGVATMQEVSA